MVNPILNYHILSPVYHPYYLSPSPSPEPSYPYYHPPGFFVQVAGSGWTRTAWTLRCQNPRPRDCPRAEFPGTRTSFSPWNPPVPEPWRQPWCALGPTPWLISTRAPFLSVFFQWWTHDDWAGQCPLPPFWGPAPLYPSIPHLKSWIHIWRIFPSLTWPILGNYPVKKYTSK